MYVCSRESCTSFSTSQVIGAIENLSHGVYGVDYSSKASCAAAVAGNQLFIIPLTMQGKLEEE